MLLLLLMSLVFTKSAKAINLRQVAVSIITAMTIGEWLKYAIIMNNIPEFSNSDKKIVAMRKAEYNKYNADYGNNIDEYLLKSGISKYANYVDHCAFLDTNRISLKKQIPWLDLLIKQVEQKMPILLEVIDEFDGLATCISKSCMQYSTKRILTKNFEALFEIVVDLLGFQSEPPEPLVKDPSIEEAFNYCLIKLSKDIIFNLPEEEILGILAHEYGHCLEEPDDKKTYLPVATKKFAIESLKNSRAPIMVIAIFAGLIITKGFIKIDSLSSAIYFSICFLCVTTFIANTIVYHLRSGNIPGYGNFSTFCVNEQSNFAREFSADAHSLTIPKAADGLISFFKKMLVDERCSVFEYSISNILRLVRGQLCTETHPPFCDRIAALALQK